MKKLLKYTLARVNEEDDVTASNICKSVDILMAIRWIKEAWEEVTKQTITKCFQYCSITVATARHDESEAENDTDDGDPFAELDNTSGYY